MKCPFKTTRKLIYDNDKHSSSYSKLIKIETEFQECDECQCPYYDFINKKRFSDASGYYQYEKVPFCKRTNEGV